LSNPAASRFALLFQLGQGRYHDAGHLHDDRCGDVRHDAERKNTQPLECTAREHVEHAQNRAGLLVEQLLQRHRVDTGNRNERANAVDDQRAGQKSEALAQLGKARRFA